MALMVVASLLLSLTAFCREGVKIVFYDVGRLYDTLPSLFYDDTEYTPSGKRAWSSERYALKIKNISRVIDSLSAEIVVLYGVESEGVVRDLTLSSQRDYSYLHRTTDYYDGLDFALLYFGDMFFVERVSVARSYTCVEGEIEGRRVAFHLARRGDKVRSLAQEQGREARDLDLLWGRFSRRDLSRLGAEDLLRDAERKGQGDSYAYGEWRMRNRLGVKCRDQKLAWRSGIYISRWLLGENLHAPHPTYLNGEYHAGYSNCLPHYIYVSGL